MFHLFLVVYENVSSSMEMIRVNSLVKSSKPSTLPVSLRQEFILTRSSLPHHGWSRTACHVCNVVVPLTRPTSASLLSHDAAQRLMGFFFLIVQHHYYRSCTLWRHQKPVFSSCHAAQDCIHTLKFSGVVWRLIICFHSCFDSHNISATSTKLRGVWVCAFSS